jgi:hypothetical protein
MNTNTNDTAYGTMTKSVISAVDYANKAENKWQSAGQAVRVYYPSRENLEGVKAQFIADAILPALDKKHAAALGVELPRKGSKEYNEMSEANRAKCGRPRTKRKKRHAPHVILTFPECLTMLSRKKKAESTPKSIEVKFNEALTDLIKACEKAEDAPFDVISVKACLVKAQKLVNSA